MERATRELLDTLAKNASKPIEEARALPAGAFASEEFFALEVEKIFRHEWLCVGREEQVAKPGDYLSITLIGEPVIVVRDDKGTLHALSNVCRHRYMQLVDGQGKTDKFVCPYHGWTYSLDGSLAGAPHMTESRIFDRRSCRLPEFRVEVWMGFVFVNFDSDAEPVAQTHHAAYERLAEHKIDEMRLAASYDKVWDGNWKIAVENGSEGYHTPMLHPGIHKWSPIETLTHENVGEIGSWMSNSLDLDTAVEVDAGFGGLMKRAHDMLPEADRALFLGYNLHPALYIDEFPGYCVWLSFLPEDVGHTRVIAGGLVYQGEIEAGGEAFLREHDEFLDVLNLEDSEPTANLQKTVGSRFTEPGPLSHKELQLLGFQRYLAKRLIDEA